VTATKQHDNNEMMAGFGKESGIEGSAEPSLTSGS